MMERCNLLFPPAPLHPNGGAAQLAISALARRYKIVGYGVKPHVQKWAHLNDRNAEPASSARAPAEGIPE